MSRSQWSLDDLPDVSSTTFMVTGGTSGIGKETARVLLDRGAHVILPSLTQEEGEATQRELGGSSEVHVVDLASFDSIRAFCAGFTAPIDVLINNAGLMSKTLTHTTEGLEMHWGVNFVGPFLLTQLLAEQIRSRIVITASMAHAKGNIDLDDPNFERRSYSMAAAYAQSKLACMLWGSEQHLRLAVAGSTVDVQLAHPGFAATSILEPTSIPAVNDFLRPLSSRVVPSAANGARPLLYAATMNLAPVSYIGPTGPMQIFGAPGPGDRADRAYDPGLARRLVDYAETLTSS